MGNSSGKEREPFPEQAASKADDRRKPLEGHASSGESAFDRAEAFIRDAGCWEEYIKVAACLSQKHHYNLCPEQVNLCA